MRRSVQATAALLLLLAACPGQQRALERAVRDYDEELQRAYATADHTRLPAVATRKEANRVQVLIDLKTATRLVLESKVEALEVTRASASGDTATVETRERWRYHDRPVTPGKPGGPEIVAAMAMRYELAREEGRWKVSSVSTLTNEILEPRGLRPEDLARKQGHGAGATAPAPAGGPAPTAPGTAPRP